MTRFILSALVLTLTATSVFAQVNENARSFPNRGNAAEDDQVMVSALETFKADFAPQEAGILHVYVDPEIDPVGTYLFKGTEASNTTMALLPTEFQQMAKKDGSKIFATRAVKLMGVEDHYVVRFDGMYNDHLELFVINDNKVEHVRTLATRSCLNGGCEQTDTWITDIDGDTNSELIVIERIMRGDKMTKEKRTVYTFDSDRNKWKKSKLLATDAPWDTIEFFEGK